MASKVSCSLPGRSIESWERRIANITTMIATTRISIASELDHGRAGFSACNPTVERTAFATPARWSLNRAVSQGSCSGINKFEQDFQDHGRGGREQTRQKRGQP